MPLRDHAAEHVPPEPHSFGITPAVVGRQKHGLEAGSPNKENTEMEVPGALPAREATGQRQGSASDTTP
jgi:hypothetical protein